MQWRAGTEFQQGRHLFRRNFELNGAVPYRFLTLLREERRVPQFKSPVSAPHVVHLESKRLKDSIAINAYC